VAASTTQVVDLIKKLWSHTESGGITWEQFADGRTFQTRSGDFVISLSSSPNPFGGVGSSGGTPYDVTITVKRLDGRQIFNASTAQTNALHAFGDKLEIPAASRATLAQLYNHLNNRDPDLDQLLRQL
jgi:hypothetical protein